MDLDVIVQEDLLQMLRAVGADADLVYLSVAITSGRRHYEYLRRHDGEPPDRLRWCKEVKQPNVEDARRYAAELRRQHPGSVVLDPAEVEKPQWSQDDYNHMWLDVIEQFASVVVASPDWAWSRGARLEVGAALFHGKAVVRLDGTPTTRAELEREARAAREQLEAMGWQASEADGLLPPFRVDHPDLRPSAPAQAFSWLINERSYQLDKFGTELDDEHTRAGLAPEQWWRRQLDNYIHRAFVLGPELPVGRQALAKFTATAAGLLESVIRVHGPLPPPGVPSGELSTHDEADSARSQDRGQ